MKFLNRNYDFTTNYRGTPFTTREFRFGFVEFDYFQKQFN